MREDLKAPLLEVEEAVEKALKEDLASLGDLTSSLLGKKKVKALVVARKEGVLAGAECVEVVYKKLGFAVELRWHKQNGESFKAGEPLAEVEGELAEILTGERVALNFLTHLCGVATLTARFVRKAREKNEKVRILDTRKTLPGLRALQKAAVRAGGGHNHRMGLYDAVLIKDNHLSFLSITEAVERARALFPMRAVEVECDGLEQAKEAATCGATAVLLDNMDPRQVRQACEAVRSIRPSVLVEVSGGVTLENVGDYAEAGPDFISVGALTHSAPAVDIGLDVI